MTDRLRRVLEAGGRGTVVSLHTPGPLLAETVGHLDVDGVFVDMQHGAFDFAGAYTIMTALGGSDVTSVVRVQWNDPATIMRVLDAGAGGVVCPLIETAEEAALFVAACHYPPQGIRSLGPNRAALLPDYLKTANDRVLTIALVESRLGYENLEAIAATPGLDAIMVGSGDLAASMDGTLKLDESKPEIIERRNRMIKVAHDHGLWAFASASVNAAANPFDSGADFLVISDNSVLIPALRKTLVTLREPRPTLASA